MYGERKGEEPSFAANMIHVVHPGHLDNEPNGDVEHALGAQYEVCDDVRPLPAR
jgi:hypothetical protein